MSSVTQPNPEARQKLNFDFDDEPVIESKEETVRKIEEISQKSGFTARTTPAKPVTRPPAPQAEKPTAPPSKPRRVRAKTGRTYPFNTKLQEIYYDKICALADMATEKEGRPVSLAEVIERGMDLLEKQMKG